MEPFDTTAMGIPYSTYASLDAPEDEFYIMPDLNKDENQVFLYISMPHRLHKKINSFQKVNEKIDPKIREDLRLYLDHPSGVESLSSIRIIVPEGIRNQIVDDLKFVNVKEGDTNQMTLVFDENRQGKVVEIDGDLKTLVLY